MADASSRRALGQLITSFRVTSVIAAAAELGLADHLANGPKTSRELGPLLGVDSSKLYRVLRALATIGVLAVEGDDAFALTPLGECLRSDIEGSMLSVARLYGRDAVVRPFFDIVHTLRTNETAFDHIFGMKIFEYLAVNQEDATIFNDAMSGLTVRASTDVSAAYDFDAFGTIVDVGGGNGTLLLSVLQAHPHPAGIIFDLAHSRARAEAEVAAAGMTDRCTFSDGDFFESVPGGADAYLMKWILHDWDDEHCITLLRACRLAMTPSSTLLIVERPIPEGSAPDPDVIFTDINMLVHAGGQERTVAEYASLLEAADLRLVRTLPTPSGQSVLEAVPISAT